VCVFVCAKYFTYVYTYVANHFLNAMPIKKHSKSGRCCRSRISIEGPKKYSRTL